jgi:hypothetical protein
MLCPICGYELQEQYVLRGDIVQYSEWECLEGDGAWTIEELQRMEDGQ